MSDKQAWFTLAVFIFATAAWILGAVAAIHFVIKFW